MSNNILTAALDLDEAIFKLGRAIRILESHSLNQPASSGPDIREAFRNHFQNILRDIQGQGHLLLSLVKEWIQIEEQKSKSNKGALINDLTTLEAAIHSVHHILANPGLEDEQL